MTARGFVLDIVGAPYALVSVAKLLESGKYLNGAGTLALAEGKEVISLPIPNAMSVEFDPVTGKSSASGLNLALTHCEFLLTQRKNTPKTSLSTTVNATSTGYFEVENATALPATGIIWIGLEAIEYSGVNTGVSPHRVGTTTLYRGALGTIGASHLAGSTVFGYNPVLLGRECSLTRFNLDALTESKIVYKGIIRGGAKDGKALQIGTLASRLFKSDLLGAPFAKGRISEFTTLTEPRYPIDGKKTQGLVLESSNKDVPFPDSSVNKRGFLLVGDEVVALKKNVTPFLATSGISVATPTQTTLDALFVTVGFQANKTYLHLEGTLIDFTNASGAVYADGEGIVPTKSTDSGATKVKLDHAKLTTVLGATDELRLNYHTNAREFTRGLFGTKREKSETPNLSFTVGEEVSEIRVLEGNSLDILFWMLFSILGDGANGVYDVLPEGWGLGLTSDDVDQDSFELVRERCFFRRYLLKEPQNLGDWLASFAIYTQSAVFVSPEGKLTCTPLSQEYPSSIGTKAVTIANTTKPVSMKLDDRLIANYASMKANYRTDGSNSFNIVYLNQDSIDFHGKKNLFSSVKDVGLVTSSGLSMVGGFIEAMLRFRGSPVSALEVDVLYDDGVGNGSFSPWRIYDTVSVTYAHTPNLEGDTGLTTDLFVIVAIRPSVAMGKTVLFLMDHPESDSLGRVSIAGIIESIDVPNKEFVLELASASNLSDPTALSVEIGNVGTTLDGTEDSDWFLSDDTIQMVDESTMSSATPTTTSDTIASIDYATRTITMLSALPAWLAVGDSIRLDLWATVKASGPESARIGVFLALADDTTLLLTGGDDAYKWGL